MLRSLSIITVIMLLVACSSLGTRRAALPGLGADRGKTIVYRDTWGIPHIYAATVEDGFYAMGRAQAEDRPEQLLINIKMALGEYASIVGSGAVNHDITHLMFDHYGVSRRNYAKQDMTSRKRMNAFAKGVMDHYAANPADVPDWWGDRKLDVHMFGAFGRYFLYNWAINEAYGDLQRAGINPGFVPRRHASNQWSVSPERSASGHALLLIDPHLDWWGVTRFWELRIHAGDLEGSGVTLVGSPFIGLGHSRDVAWAMTTGGPDTADVYELTIDPADHHRYKFDGEWRTMISKEFSIDVRGEASRKVRVYFSHQGPILAWQLDAEHPKAYAGKIAYDDDVDPQNLTRHLNFGKDYRDVIAGLSSLGTFPQNVMTADTSGNIYYQRAGRVPIRAQGYDWSRPVDGSTSKTEWQGFHPASDQLQVLNPAEGYMQNCNIPPDAMMVQGPFRFEDYLPEIYSSAHYGPARHGWINQRGARALELLSADDSVTVEEALAYAVDVKPFGIDRWLDALAQSLDLPSLSGVQRLAAEEVIEWDGRLLRDSGAALKYAYFKMALAELLSQEAYDRLREEIDQWYSIVNDKVPDTLDMSDENAEDITVAFLSSLHRIQEDFGHLDAVYGDAFRVGRDDESWPVGGGGNDRLGLTTLRTIGFGDRRTDHTRWGKRGQTSTQIIELSKPIKSWLYLPVGQSDRPDSSHYADQAATVFSERHLKPSWWLPEDLQGHIESRTEYQRVSD